MRLALPSFGVTFFSLPSAGHEGRTCDRRSLLSLLADDRQDLLAVKRRCAHPVSGAAPQVLVVRKELRSGCPATAVAHKGSAGTPLERPASAHTTRLLRLYDVEPIDVEPTMTADPPQTTAADVDDGAVAATAAGGEASMWGALDDLVDEWGRQSFPASDPPANW
jgi:hypothetical protein